MSSHDDALRSHYASMWSRALPEIESGSVEIDRILAARAKDRRRGFTLIARPSEAVRERLMTLLRDLREADSTQYYYQPSELHVTVLSLFTATEDHARFASLEQTYRQAVDVAVGEFVPFELEFCGLSASPAAVMVCGYPQDATLEQLRARLRQALKARGLSEDLDRRYRLITAHVTVARFRAELSPGSRFAAVLKEFRSTAFGRTRVSELELVRSDWYLSEASCQSLARYPAISKAGP